MPRMSRTVASAPSRSALLTTKHVGRPRGCPALAAWIAVAHAGRQQHQRGVGQRRPPRPRSAPRRRSRPARRRTPRRRAPAAPAASPGSARRGARGWPSSGCRRAGRARARRIRTRSPSSAPPENGRGRVDREHADPQVAGAQARVTSAVVVVDLPTPGAPVTPTTHAEPACGASAAITSRSSGEASSTSEISRATARGDPSRASRDQRGDVVTGRATLSHERDPLRVQSASRVLRIRPRRGRGRRARRPGRRRRTARPRRCRRRGARARAPGAGRSARRTCRSGGRARWRRR